MTKNTMTALTVSGPSERLDEAIERFFMGRDIHPEDAVSFLSGLRALERPEGDDPAADALSEADKLLTALGLKPTYQDFDERGFTIRGCRAYLDTLAQTLDRQQSERETLRKQRADNAAAIEVLTHFSSVSEPVSELAALRYVSCRLGRIHPGNWEACQREAEAMEGLLVIETDRSEEWLWLMALSTRDQTDATDALLSRYAFENISPAVVPLGERSATQALDELRAADKDAADKLAALDEAQRELLDTNRNELLSRRSFLKFKSTCFAARRYAGLAKGRFYLVGWVDSDKADAFAAQVQAEPGFRCMRGGDAEHTAPVRLKKRRFASIFDPILKMYGLPSNGESDPRLFLAITYTLFFGIMFGDVGQGACLVVLGLLLWKKTGGGIWRIFSVCGVSSVIFGLIYGSCFGLEELFPWGGFHVLEGENLMTTLLVAVALGCVVIVCCMLMNIANALRRRDYTAGLFSANGLCGLVFYVSVLALIVSLYTKLFVFPGVCVWLCVVLPLLLIWFGEPLGKMLAGDKSWREEKLGDLLMMGFFDIFESLLSYMSNTMSFLRVGAFAISHAGMMMVVYLIADVCGNMAGNLLVAVFGNIFVAVLEAGLASIQIIRLQFYEMFGRYYNGRGRAFQSLSVDYN